MDKAAEINSKDQKYKSGYSVFSICSKTLINDTFAFLILKMDQI